MNSDDNKLTQCVVATKPSISSEHWLLFSRNSWQRSSSRWLSDKNAC